MDDNQPDSIAERLDLINEGIATAARRAGRAPDEVTLVAVSKKVGAERLAEAAEAGVRVFGESRVQEAAEKIPVLPSRLVWHFIGNLQSNKVRRALPLFPLIHSVGSLDLARDIDRIAAECGLFPKILLEVNLAGEATKHGFTANSLRDALDALLDLERIEIQGLMAIPPFRPEPEEARADFAAIRAFRDDLVASSGIPLPALSMGMSHDYGVAVEEGATHVRVGSALFGSRS